MNEPIQVKISTKNGIGVASLIVAIVTFAGSWIPLLNIISIIIAVVAILLGIVSFIMVLFKKSKGFIMPIIGIVVGILSIILAVNMNNYAFNSSSNSSSNSSKNNETSSNANNNAIMDTKGELGNYAAEIVSSRKAKKDTYNKDAMVELDNCYKLNDKSSVTIEVSESFTLTNKSKVTRTFSVA
ncbi:MAG: hypothetical protein RsTaC01_0409 [Candidatus Paraimprobicoccus trichonymphae]|uniref:Uncharacterized protein n=1 Tax=Candidatus Paraimprobicoccus trichonymphae TaxID=3033793 RepID=A0AA48IBT2_9FIRM|nr:MAG: hypothetical protein RsTaC01_0409 [Candidatus Paraimprobicoccus trichonymphae]